MWPEASFFCWETESPRRKSQVRKESGNQGLWHSSVKSSKHFWAQNALASSFSEQKNQIPLSARRKRSQGIFYLQLPKKKKKAPILSFYNASLVTCKYGIKYIESFKYTALHSGHGFSMVMCPRPCTLNVKVPKMLLYESFSSRRYQFLKLEPVGEEMLDFKHFVKF